MPRAVEGILDFWLGEVPGTEADVERSMKRWFGGDAETDALIASRFGASLTAAAAGELDAWAQHARGRLALILLLDQFPRSIHRGTPAAFAHDARALELALEGIDTDQDRTLGALERLFLYMPMQHAESLEVQRRSVAQFEALARDTPAPHLRKALAGAADYARQHRDIIARFGRFPHRNAALGRSNTPEEARYLARGAPKFGQ